MRCPRRLLFNLQNQGNGVSNEKLLNITTTTVHWIACTNKTVLNLWSVLNQITNKSELQSCEIFQSCMEFAEGLMNQRIYFLKTSRLSEISIEKSFLFNWDSLYARLNSHHKVLSYKKKKYKKIKVYRKSVQKQPAVKVSVNSRLLDHNQITGQRKAFFRQRIQSSCTRKKTVDIDTLASSRNGDTKTI